MESVAFAPLPPLTVKLHAPAVTGVTVNDAAPLDAIVAMPLHVEVDAEKLPVSVPDLRSPIARCSRPLR
jgi:hypothetical protein